MSIQNDEMNEILELCKKIEDAIDKIMDKENAADEEKDPQ